MVSASSSEELPNSEKTCDSERTSVLSFLSGASSDGGRYAPQIGKIVGILKRLNDEMSTDMSALEEEELDRKTKHQGLMKAETEEIFVLSRAIQEKETLALKCEQSAKEAAQRHQDAEARKQADEVVEVAKAVEAADAGQQRVEEAAIEQSAAEAQERAEAQPRPTRPPLWRDKLQSTGMHERQPRPLGERKAAEALGKQKGIADAQAKQLSQVQRAAGQAQDKTIQQKAQQAAALEEAARQEADEVVRRDTCPKDLDTNCDKLKANRNEHRLLSNSPQEAQCREGTLQNERGRF